jgi:AraC-like DNA-binding protein
MNISFTLTVILLFAAIAIGLFSSLLLALSVKNKLANRLLSMLMLAICGWLLDAFFRSSGLYHLNANLYFLPIYYSLAIGPLLYFYSVAITNNAFTFEKKYFVHFFPVSLQALFYWVVAFLPYNIKYFVWFHIHLPYTYRLEYDGTWISLVVYLIFALKRIRNYQHWLTANYSDTGRRMLNWLKVSLMILILVCITWFAEAVLRDFFDIYYKYDLSGIFLCLVICAMGILAYAQSGMTMAFDANMETPGPQNMRPEVNVDMAIIRGIEKAMHTDRLFLNPELTLAGLATHVARSPKAVSININAHYQKTFNTFINTYRVDEIKRRFRTDDIDKFNLLGIALASGFNSKTTFNRIFKEVTGVSPTAYLQNQGQ